MARAVILARVSDPKQMIKGDSLDDQLIKCNHFIESQGWKKDREFTLIESGRKGERKYFWEVYDYCKNKNKTGEKIDYLVVLNIGRFTRGGGEIYLKLKRDFEDIGVNFTDIYKTVGEKVNTLDEYGYKYDWSEYSPSEPAEVYEANQRRDYVRAQLTQMISGCIRNIRKGYWNGPAPFGLMNKKVDTPTEGLRNVLADNTKEDYFVKRIFEMRSKGIPDKQIVGVINSLGFKTRLMSKRDPRTKVRVGSRGGVPITVKKIQEYIMNPIYVGIIVAKWTQFQPVKAIMFDGLVDVETFNAANKGKIYIVKNADDSVEVRRNVKWANVNQPDKRMRNNPDYPFKPVLLCPICHKEVKASASKGRSGERFPTYFCERKPHKRWHEKRDVVHTTMHSFLDNVKFTDESTRLFQELFFESWQEKRRVAVDDSQKAEGYVAGLLLEQKNTLDSFKSATNPSIKKALEEDYEKLDVKIKEARGKRNEFENKEVDIKLVLRYAAYLVEHPGELLTAKENNNNRRYLFGLVFEELPTYDELISGTAKLQPVFQLKGNENASKEDLVR